MKKILSFLLVLSLIASLFTFSAVTANAEETEQEFVRLVAKGNDPYGTFKFSSAGNHTEIDPDVVKWACIRYRVNNPVDSTGVDYKGQFYVTPAAEPYVPIYWDVSEGWHTIVVNLTQVAETASSASIWDSTHYTTTSTIRFDFLEPDRDAEAALEEGSGEGEVNEGDSIDIAYIGFFENEADAQAYTGTESTPYCILDVDALVEPSGKNRLKTIKYENGEAVVDGQLDEIVVNEKASDSSAISIVDNTLAVLTCTVPDGYVMRDFMLTGCPTWSNTAGDSDAMAEAYIWRGDYDDTLSYDPIATVEIFDHQDNTGITFNFGTALRYGHQYLIVVSATNTGKIGFWTGDELPEDTEWVVYFNEYEDDVNIPPISYTLMTVGELPDYDLSTPEPTVAPTAAPTAEPTEAPTAAPTAAPTEAPEAEDDAEEESSPVGLIIGICAAVVVIAAAVVVILKKKKK